MCALQPDQQLDHDFVANFPQIILNEVTLFFNDGSGSFELALDPGEVSVMFWDDQRRDAYLQSLGREDRSTKEISLTARHPSFDITTAEVQPPPAGVPGLLYFEMKDGSVYVTHEPVVTWRVVARYHSQLTKQSYEVQLPTKSDVSHGVDALFWNRDACERFRAASGLQNPHNLYKPDGSQAHGRNVHPTPLWTPDRTLTRQPKFHSTTCNLCYHYENCQWACTVDAP